MHRVCRPRTPKQLSRIRKYYTPKWIAFYKKGKGRKPTDSRWRDFLPQLSRSFSYLCGYCESQCRGEVDHFRPKSKAPHLVYCWSNWIYSCHDCNNIKREKWPICGYFDPCTSTAKHSPELVFQYDIHTGEILPNSGIDQKLFSKANKMIDDLELNASHHLRKRLRHLFVLSKLLTIANPNRRIIAQYYCKRSEHLSSLSRCFYRAHGISIKG